MLLLAGCSNLSKNSAEKKVYINNQLYSLKIADTPNSRQTGLMNRETLASDRGMLFVFDQKEYLQFWMKDTLIPLQLVLLDGCQVVDLLEMAKEPDPSNPQKTYKSNKMADKAIEVNTSTFDRSLIGQSIPELCN